MCSRGKRGSVTVLSLLAAITSVKQGYAHPGCKAGTVALTQGNTIFCPTNQDPLYQYGICCDPVMEANIILQLDGSSASTEKCAAMYQEVRGAFSPIGSHARLIDYSVFLPPLHLSAFLSRLSYPLHLPTTPLFSVDGTRKTSQTPMLRYVFLCMILPHGPRVFGIARFTGEGFGVLFLLSYRSAIYCCSRLLLVISLGGGELLRSKSAEARSWLKPRGIVIIFRGFVREFFL